MPRRLASRRALPAMLLALVGAACDRGPATDLEIHDLQGIEHRSPFAGRAVSGVRGVVTAVEEQGHFLQSLAPDSDPRTSEGIYVFTGDLPIRPGDVVSVSGTVEEYRGGAGELTETRIGSLDDPASVEVEHIGQDLPTPPPLPPLPTHVGSADGRLRPEHEVMDAYESLEGMRVSLGSTRVVGPTNRYGEIGLIRDTRSMDELLSQRGVLVTRGSVGPFPMLLDDRLAPTPDVGVGQRSPAPMEAIVGYSFGNYKLWSLQPAELVGELPAPDTAPPRRPGEVRIVSYNVENLHPAVDPRRFDAIAAQVVRRLGAPDLLVLQEIQDSSGPRDDGVTEADRTYELLIAAIRAAGGPVYEARDVAPADGADGGQPGGNIRVGLLIRTGGLVELVDRGPPATPQVDAIVEPLSGRPVLRPSPGRLATSRPTFEASRKPLVGELRVAGRPLFVVGLHLSSRRGDDPLFGQRQPAQRGSEERRRRQAGIVRDFVGELLDHDPEAWVVVAGDLNDGPDSAVLAELSGDLLSSPMRDLPPAERYTYIWEGRGEAIDHILVSTPLARGAQLRARIVHLNAEWPSTARASDHDPVLLDILLP